MEDSLREKGRGGLVVAVLAICAFVGFSSYNYLKFKSQKKEEAKEEAPIPVRIVSIRKGHLRQSLDLTGDVEPLMQVYVHPKIGGKIIERIFVERGDLVKKGTLVAELEKNTIRAQIREAQAGLKAAKAKLKEVEANLRVIKKDRSRLKNLARDRVVSQQQLDQIDARYEAALAQKKLALADIERTHASLGLLDILLRDHDIYSPISGWVSERYVDAGTMSDTKKPIVRISREDTVKIVTTVTEDEYPLVRKGMDAKVRVDAFPGKVFKGSVALISPTLDPATRSAQIEIHIQNKSLALRSGMFAHMKLTLGRKEVLVVDKDALIRLPGTGNYYVYVVKDARAVMRNVKIGLIQERLVEVKKGLRQGDQVVVRGQNRLRDGSRVKAEASPDKAQARGTGKNEAS